MEFLTHVANVAGDVPSSAVDGPASVGANLVDNVVKCGPLAVTDDRDAIAILENALTAGEGAFATPTGTDTVQAENGDIAIAPNTGNSWNLQVGTVAVFIGRIDNFALPTVPGTFPYRIGLIYDGTKQLVISGDDHFNVEFCKVTGGTASQQRIGRSRGPNNNTLLQLGGAVCNLPDPSSVIGRTVDKVMGFFTPTPLQALMFAPPPWSGSTGGLESDFAVVEPSAVKVTTPPGISNAVVGDTNDYPLTALADFSNPPVFEVPVEGVDFHFAISGNQGQPVELSGPGCSGTACTVSTDELGNATLSVAFLKPGGYTVVLTVTFGGFTFPSQTYTNIQITGN
jgi:hypothetical protein